MDDKGNSIPIYFIFIYFQYSPFIYYFLFRHILVNHNKSENTLEKYVINKKIISNRIYLQLIFFFFELKQQKHEVIVKIYFLIALDFFCLFSLSLFKVRYLE